MIDLPGLDRQVLVFLNGFRGTGLDAFFALLTHLGAAFLLFPLSLLIAVRLASSAKRSAVLLLPLSLLASTVVSQVLKWVFQRARPAVFESVIDLPGDFAMPSAHAAQSMAFAVACFLLLPNRLRWFGGSLLFGLATLVGLSRLYLQVHWPSDVLAGWVIGCLCAIVSAHLLALVDKKTGFGIFRQL